MLQCTKFLQIGIFACISEWIHEHIRNSKGQLIRSLCRYCTQGIYICMAQINARMPLIITPPYPWLKLPLQLQLKYEICICFVCVCVRICSWPRPLASTLASNRMSMGITDRKCENAWIIEHLSRAKQPIITGHTELTDCPLPPPSPLSCFHSTCLLPLFLLPFSV